MAHLWHPAPAGWAPLPLSGDCVVLAADAARLPQPRIARTPATGQVALRQMAAEAPAPWLLLVPPRLPAWVNGQRVRAGVRVLRDRDELRLPRLAPVFFSTELLPAIATYPVVGRAAVCPRCRQALAPGSPAVRCPNCGTWHHESPECNCWTYAAACAQCVQPTALGTDYRWRPEEPVP